MKNECFDIGVIQTFVDGELGSTETEKVVGHVAACDECTLHVAQLQSENEALFAALDYELNPLVPTERLREKVFSSIRENEARDSGWWSTIAAGLGLTGLLRSPVATAFASVIMLLGVTGAALWFGLPPFEQSVERVLVEADPSVQSIGLVTDGDTGETIPDSIEQQGREVSGDPNPIESTVATAPLTARTKRELKTPIRRMRPVGPAVARRTIIVPDPEDVDSPAEPGSKLAAEGGYLRTIATLNRTVNDNKDYVLRPSERVVFERDLAVVNDAIMKMRGEIEKNPENSGAREVLKSSYKNKIDLLNSVADRSETVASRD